MVLSLVIMALLAGGNLVAYPQAAGPLPGGEDPGGGNVTEPGTPWTPGYGDYRWVHPTKMFYDSQGNFSYHFPSTRSLTLPIEVEVRGRDGDSGHVSYGALWLQYQKGYRDEVARAERVYVKLALNEASSSIPENTCRISIATQWLREGLDPALSSSYSYLEFDIWNNEGWTPQFPGTRINWYAPDFWMPTIEVKHDQMEVGTVGEYIIEAKAHYEAYYGTTANLTAVYVVVGKAEPEGSLDVDLTVLDIGVSADPALVEPEVEPLFPEGRPSWIGGLLAQTFLDAQEAVVLGRPLPAGGRAGLDLAAA